MLRVGLTGELGSGKSTVARLLAEHGAVVLSSDEMARAMMQPGHAVYQAIVACFGPEIVLADGQLDRAELARLAFSPGTSRVEELNAIIHPAVLAEQERLLDEIGRMQPRAIVVIESALIFTTKYSGQQPWRKRFDRLVLVTAPDEVKLQRYLGRVRAGRQLSAAEQQAYRQDALARLAAQRIPPSAHGECLVIDNSGEREALVSRTKDVFRQLRLFADDLQQ